MTELNLFDLIAAIDIMVLERRGKGSFGKMGTMHDWFRRLYPHAITTNDELRLGEEDSFLEVFLQDAEDFWRMNDRGRLESDPWTEVDHSSGDEYVFGATAVCVGERKFLLIQLLGASFRDRQALFQKARENLLGKERLERIVAERTADLRKLAEDLRKALESIIHVIALTVETRDPYTAGHQRRVANLAKAIALEMGLLDGVVKSIYVAAVIHDLGKISVPAEILSKPSRLTENEFSLIKDHARVGNNILKDVVFPWDIARMVLQHHERINGSGYPVGLSGVDILLEAKVIMVADVVEAMASHRPYRPALGVDKALEEISKNRGVFYDPDVVDACVTLFKEKGFQLE
jgi:putative nucleotidyltransferase with HDIG domain